MIPQKIIDKLLTENETHGCSGDFCIKIVAIADLPTRFGKFQVVSFWNDTDKKEHAAVIKGNIVNKKMLL